jgi:hypothetical protein
MKYKKMQTSKHIPGLREKRSYSKKSSDFVKHIIAQNMPFAL